jgi:hypothetical protein
MEGKQLSRRGVLAATAGIAVGTGSAVVAGVPASAAPATDDVGILASVSFAQWGTIFLSPGQIQEWWFTWIFDSSRWSRMSFIPLAESPANSSVQILTEFSNNFNQLWVRLQNNSTTGVIFRPTVAVVS